VKYLSYIINAILAIAVAVLFYFHFSEKSGNGPLASGQSSAIHAGKNFSIVYVNIDSLLNNYDYFHDLQAKFEDKQQELEAELNSRSRQYEAGAMDYQNKVQKGLVTRREAAELEQQLLAEQQNLLALRDELSMQLAEEEQVGNRKLIDKIMEYLKDYNRNYNYQFIFSNSFGDNVLFANDSLDITSSVLEGLNRVYNENKDSK